MAKVEAVLDAARAILSESGLDGLTARDLAARSGVAVPTLYRYFASVDEVVDVLLDEHARAASTTLEVVLADLATDGPPATIEQVFRAVGRAHLDLYAARPDLVVVWADPVLAERRRVIDEAADRLLARRVGEHLVEVGLVPRLTPVVVTRLEAHWAAAGALLGAVLLARGRARADLVAELDALVVHLASRY